jgi:TRAP-type C4-dicarboxylate transport system substrate-binding protein
MSADWHDDLDDETRGIVDAAVDTANAKNRIWTVEAAAMERQQLEEAGVTITELSDAALAEFEARSQEVWDTLMPEGSVDEMKALAERAAE